MTNEDILVWARRIYYARLDLEDIFYIGNLGVRSAWLECG